MSIDNSVISGLAHRSVMQSDECKKCPYKFVCLGCCPKNSEGQLADMTKMTCGVFGFPEILDNIEFDYRTIANVKNNSDRKVV